MNDATYDVDVLIAGAGPVGLFLANECFRRGLRSRIVETHPGQSEHSKALAIFPRTLEIFDMAGLVGPFLERANRVTSASVVAHGHELGHIRFAPEETPYSFIAMVPQDVTEMLLVEELRRRGAGVEYETSFVSAIQDAGGVRATLDRKGRREEVAARFVVGCDGAHSAVRHLLALTFEGAEYEETFLLADVETNDALASDQLQLCPSELGPLAVFPMSATRRRIVATIGTREGDAPALDLVQRILRERAPEGLEARALHWSSYFRIHHRHAAQLRVGRMFIAGDAAHIHSPFGGQGMNTGLQDAWNLAWKLDLALHGRGNERLLDSYAAERLPVIKSVIETTDLMTRALSMPNKVAQALRDLVIPVVTSLPPFQHAFVRRLSGLGIAYPGSPILEGDGERYFDDSLRGGAGIRSRFLLLFDDEDASLAAAARELADSLDDVVELRSRRGHGAMLVRPDGYVAFSARGHDAKAAIGSMRALLELQIR